MTPPMERIQILELIEKDVINCLQSAGQVFVELSKEKSSVKQAEAQTHQFLKLLSTVESKLRSGYASQKVLQMAWHRLEHARSRVNELDRIKNKHLHGRSNIRSTQPLASATGASVQISTSNPNS
ncbi:hypothetical protein G9C98_004945 [Cotesia typhae]|uniref:Mediator of RNA polymerase II transcription subunit 11 n=1 Tax=Cotesia typhae TaxID=2053667 RepID=A0A8J5R034_9HYME|nr:hypothetical protein G9C98_004945 [Cotesia typhae]